MNRIIIAFALAIAVSLGTTMLLANRAQRPTGSTSEAAFNADGAFRDGIFVGHLTAERGRPAHPMIGRWSTEKDRASFTAGYRRGYNDFLASAGSSKKRPRPE